MSKLDDNARDVLEMVASCLALFLAFGLPLGNFIAPMEDHLGSPTREQVVSRFMYPGFWIIEAVLLSIATWCVWSIAARELRSRRHKKNQSSNTEVSSQSGHRAAP